MQNQLQKSLEVMQIALESLRMEESEITVEKIQQLLTIAIDNTEQLQILVEQLQQKFSLSALSAIGINLSPNLQQESLRLLPLTQLEADFRLALQRQEFFLCYQPIVFLATGKLKGIEALVRWQHPTRGLLLPAEFIPLAEATGLIVPLTRWVLQEACAQLKSWQQQFPDNSPLTINVNISAQHFSQPTLIEDVQTVLEQTGLPPTSLKLEITESAVIHKPEVATKTLYRLREMDVQAHLDDFGTGHSSLSYLCNFPIDTLKLDRSFITSITTKPDHLCMVHSILQMAWNLGINIVAEGIETKDQLAYLRTLKCDFGQGNLFSPPLTARLLEAEWLHSNTYCHL